jgi:4a-hydroxytetrahydrobiopterin dehydratase
MNRVAEECKKAKHHPEWANVYNTVFVRWTTHEPRGLSEKDVKMAGVCDEIAREEGVLKEEGVRKEGGADEEGGLECLADGLAKEAGDCCVPKKL